MDRPRVVLADNNRAILDCVSRQLVDEFEVVATLMDGQAALDAIMVLDPDAVVLDISMPRMSGLEVASRLMELPHPPRIVFLSVHEDQDFIDATVRAGAAGYVLKRNLFSQLAPTLRRALARVGRCGPADA
jgi:DNA-binding NarL/FixJ family response regulator